MGIMDVGLSASQTGTESLAGIRVNYGENKNAYLKWHTESGLDWNGWFDISARFCYVPRGVSGAGESGYGDWIYNAGEWFYERVPANQCNPRKEAGSPDWWWSHSLSIDGLLSKMTGGSSSLSFSGRMYDAIKLEIHIKSVYANGLIDQWEREHSSRVDVTLWIGYFPRYTLTDIYYSTKSSVTIEYTAPDWERTDDRWGLEGLSVADRGDVTVGDVIWGRINDRGKLSIPTSALTEHLMTGAKVDVNIRMNAAFRDIGMDFGRILGTAALVNRVPCNTPLLEASIDDDAASVKVHVKDAGDIGIPFNSVSIKMVDGPYSFDERITTADGVAVFDFVPLSKSLSFTAVAETATKISDAALVKSVEVPAQDRFILERIKVNKSGELKPIDRALLLMNCSWSSDTKQTQEIIKLAGRRRPSVFKGIGGERSVRLSGEVFRAPYDPESDIKPYQQLSSGDSVIVRMGDGQRYLCAIESIDISASNDSPVYLVSADMQEIDG